MAVTIEIKVVPQSGKTACKIDKSGMIKCMVKNAPENGKANRELIKFLAKALKIPQDQVAIVSGATSRKKRIRFEPFESEQEVINVLKLDKQMKLF